MLDRRPRVFAAIIFASIQLATPAQGQAGLGHIGDASTTPRGTLRFQALTAWTRYDSRFMPAGVAPLGALFSADSLGVAQLPRLAPAESLVRSATGEPFSLTLGRSRLDATARQEIIPLGLEYGITDYLSIGVLVPFVRQRIAIQFRLDTAGGFTANVGPNRHRTDAQAMQNNATVQAQFSDAAQQLQARLAGCQADPAAVGCAALLARQAEAEALISASLAFAAELEALYGSPGSDGMPFVPTAQSAAQVAIAGRIAAFNAQYRDLLSAGVDLLSAVPFGAGGPAGVADLRSYFATEGLRDSLATRERLGVGDVEVGVRLRVLSRMRTDSQPLGIQFTVASALRLATGSDLPASEVADMRLGESVERLDSRAILDLSLGRVGLLASGRYEQAIGAEDPAAPDTTGMVLFPTNHRVTELHIAPRWHLSGPLAIHAAYSLRTSDRSGGDRLAGGGVSFSNLFRTPRGRTPPIEMRFTHLESISGDAGRPKFFRDQLEVRIYYRLIR